MGFTHFPRGVTSMGIPLLGTVIPPFNSGNIWFVNAKFGSNDNSGLGGWTNALETMVYLNTVTGDGLNDVVLLDGLKSSGGPTYKYQENAQVSWSNDNIHVYGCGTFGVTDPLPEWSLDSTGRATTAVGTLVMTGVGNTFTNIRLTGNGTDSANLCALHDQGENNVYTNCMFMKTNDLGETTVCDVLAHGDTSTFRNCKFGATWYTITAARQNVLASGTSAAGRMKHNYFEDCYFVCNSTSADHVHFRVNSTDSLAFESLFKDCIFHQAIVSSISTVQSTVAVESIANLVEGNVMFINCSTNADSFATTANRFTLIGHGLAESTTVNVGIAITPS